MTNPKDIYPLPTEGDIVWCRFPKAEKLGEPSLKSRPALVIGVSETDHAVEVVYGTTQKTHQIYPSEFVIDPKDPGYSVSGLAGRTKFDFNRSVKLLFNSEWFTTAPSVTRNTPLPKLGILHPSYYRTAKHAFDNS